MQFTTTTLLITSLMASGLMATPFADPEPDLVELSSEQHEGGSIVQYGEDKRSMAPRADCGGFFQPACPKTCKKWSLEEPECDDKNGGTNNVCENLLNDLFGNQSIELQKDAKQLCWKNEDGKTGCCVKWTKTVPGLTKGDLKEHANKIVKKCDINGISGKYNTVEMRGVCMSYCMSSGAGCKDESDYS